MVALAGAVWVASGGKPLSLFGPRSAGGTSSPEQRRCEKARGTEAISWRDDVRFVECDRPRPTTGEAFTLGDSFYEPAGPVGTEARLYSPGHCDHNGGSIADFTLFYKPEHIAAAIACSRNRCQARDAIGCRDLGALHWIDVLPAVTKNEREATAAFEEGCRLGDAESCLSLGILLDDRGESERARRYLTAACLAARPEIGACSHVGASLMKAGKDDEAKPFLQRACRGTTAFREPYREHRESCSPLAALAAKRGDTASQAEYLRLACAYGGGEGDSCDRYGLMLLRKGDEAKALPYLCKGCGFLPNERLHSPEACQAAERLSAKLGERCER